MAAAPWWRRCRRRWSAIEDVRPAEAGEFTRRAFLNGKMDLVEAEALADLIAAETEAQRRFASSGAGGAQSALYAGWRKRIVHARAMIEAELDFSDESDVPGSVAGAVWDDVRRLVADIEAHVAGFHRAEIIREGYSVVIPGAPNAGKSSLLNALARRDVAIVTDEPGTTRDLVHVALDLGGVKVVVTDTAGIREGAGPGRGDRDRARAGERAAGGPCADAGGHGRAGRFRRTRGGYIGAQDRKQSRFDSECWQFRRWSL